MIKAKKINKAHFECQRDLIRAPKDDFQVELSMTQLGDRTMCLLHAEQTEYHTLLRNQEDFEHWPWYDAEELPRGVTEEDWSNRKKAWFSTLKVRTSYTCHMKLLGQSVPSPDRSLIRSKIRPPFERAYDIAFEQLFSERVEQEWKGLLGDMPSTVAMRIFTSMNEECQHDDDFKKVLLARCDVVAAAIEKNNPFVIIPEPTRERTQ